MAPLRNRRRSIAAVVLSVVVLVAGTRATAIGAGAGRAGTECAGRRWVTSWMTAPQGVSEVYENQTVRSIVRLTAAGDAVRVTLSNRFGHAPVRFNDVHVDRRAAGAAVVPGTVRAITFAGRPAVTVAAGDEVVSDGVRLQVEPGADIAVSFHVVGSAVLARHEQALQRSYATPPGTGAHGGDVGGGAFTETIDSWLGVTAVDVAAPAGVGAVAALGDSLTDGTGATFGAHRRWTDRLADRFDGRAAVINAGISANLAARGYAPAGHPAALDLPVGAADRLVPDVLLRSGVTDLVVYAGINDILFGLDPDPAASVIAAHQRIISAAHAAGLRVIGATLTPASFVDPSQEAARQRVNRWIRTSAGYDRVVDFDAAVADPAMPRRLRPAFDDDGIHLTDAGYAALAASVDESLLQGHACA